MYRAHATIMSYMSADIEAETSVYTMHVAAIPMAASLLNSLMTFPVCYQLGNSVIVIFVF